MHQPGARLAGRYRLDERIGAGGMGEVWRATDETLGRVVAVKIMQPALMADPGFVERFRAEARMMASVSHPGVVAVHDFRDDASVAFLVMEYVEGESLARLLGRARRLPAARTMQLVAQAADALHAAHQTGVVHRDVKPANLLVRSNSMVVLTDFGIARTHTGAQLTATGAVLGTPSYLAPEQIMGEPATPRSDVYALGVVAYECLAGRRPFDRENAFAIAMARLHEPPPTLPADLPEVVLAVVERALARDPATRWASAAEFAAACRHAATQPAASPVPVPGPPPRPAPPDPPVPRSPRSVVQSPHQDGVPPAVSPPHRYRSGQRLVLNAAGVVAGIAVVITTTGWLSLRGLVPFEITDNSTLVMTASLLALLALPGLALFYGGYRAPSRIRSLLLACLGALVVVGLLWVLYGYSVAFGGRSIGGLFGDLAAAGLRDEDSNVTWLSSAAFVTYTMVLAIVATALTADAVAGRARLGAWLLFAAGWSTLVVFPVMHWIWAGGWLGNAAGLYDFAGGLAVHASAGAAALALALVPGRRAGWSPARSPGGSRAWSPGGSPARFQDRSPPGRATPTPPLVLLGAALLWLGLASVNAGSELAADDIAGTAIINTQLATAASVAGWLLVERLRSGHSTLRGAGSGAIAGVVAIGPGCVFVDPVGAIAIGAITGVICALLMSMRHRVGHGDWMGVVAIHLGGGVVGALLVGFLSVGGIEYEGFAHSFNAGVLYGGGLGQLVSQAVGTFAVAGYSFLVAWLLARLIENKIGFRRPSG